MAQINILITSEKNTIANNEKIQLVAEITSKGIDIQNASVSVVSAEGGVFYPSAGISDVNGVFKTIFVPDINDATDKNYNIVFTASKTGLVSGTKTYLILATAPKQEYFDKDIEFQSGVYKVRKLIKDALVEILDQDPDFYPSTGASQKPIVLNGYSLTTRTFPQVVVTGGRINSRDSSVGNHFVGDLYGDSGEVIKSLQGGWYDLTFNIVVITESESVKELLLDKCVQIIWAKQRQSLLAKDVLIKSVNSGAETTEPYGARLLYAGSIDINCATQWFLQSLAKNQVSGIEPDSTIQ